MIRRHEITRCVVCESPCAQPWHRLCARCWNWHRVGRHIAALVAALREIKP